MITRIEAKNYRCLKGVAQSLSGFHVIAGPNGSGKSTFFEVPRVLGAFARDGLTSLWSECAAQSLEEMLHHGKGNAFELAVEMTTPDALSKAASGKDKEPARRVLRYEVRVGRDKADEVPRILSENLFLLPRAGAERGRSRAPEQQMLFPAESAADFSVVHESAPRNSGWRTVARKSKGGNSYFKGETTEWNLQLRNGPDESALRALPSDERFELSNWFKQQLTGGVQQLALATEAMRKSSGPLKRKGFLTDGSNLPHVIARLAEDRPGFDAWLEHLRTVLPIHAVDTVLKEEDKHRYLRLAYTYAPKVFVPSWHLSDGTLRMLALTLLAYLPDNTGTYLIEEPENGIHPQAMEAVYQSLSSVYDGQILVATHSPVLVGLISPDRLLCFSKTKSGETDVVTGDRHPRLKDWRKDMSLARLYAAGVLS